MLDRRHAGGRGSREGRRGTRPEHRTFLTAGDVCPAPPATSAGTSQLRRDPWLLLRACGRTGRGKRPRSHLPPAAVRRRHGTERVLPPPDSAQAAEARDWVARVARALPSRLDAAWGCPVPGSGTKCRVRADLAQRLGAPRSFDTAPAPRTQSSSAATESSGRARSAPWFSNGLGCVRFLKKYAP